MSAIYVDLSGGTPIVAPGLRTSGVAGTSATAITFASPLSSRKGIILACNDDQKGFYVGINEAPSLTAYDAWVGNRGTLVLDVVSALTIYILSDDPNGVYTTKFSAKEF